MLLQQKITCHLQRVLLLIVNCQVININKEKNGPRMKPCGTPALTGNNSDVCSFSSTLWNLLPVT